jgi:cell division septal protein FtsQ
MSRSGSTKTGQRRGRRTSSRTGKTQGTSSSINSRRIPPVLSRSEIGLNTIVMDNRPAPRRRVDVALSSPGAEIRLPAVPAVNNKWRLVSGMLSISLLLGLILFTNAGFFQVDSIQMQGLERYTEGEIIQAINIMGSSIFFIHPERIKQDLQLTYPGLSNVEVRVAWPSSVDISLEERYPVLAWNWEGHVRWVDKNGVAFDPHDQGLDVVQIKSAILPPTVDDRFVDPRIVKTVAALADYMPEGVDMIYDPKHGLGWNDARGWIVHFGFNDDDAAKKMVVYQALVDYLEGKRITPAVINVEFLDSPYFRMEQ